MLLGNVKELFVALLETIDAQRPPPEFPAMKICLGSMLYSFFRLKTASMAARKRIGGQISFPVPFAPA